ncbi:MAG: PAS domain S-box protein [Hydrogenophaga sp.]|uniref:PAS domain S-box protein n=1 Tax=Hydrogenophaga sp. TaxID=1904254 RepID=UPI00261444FC|nr:PAS domain S-box protein [Hydrogenophaga sp.]MDM7942194.1 PAS domain S-box protein [Hydrogenophaga sp.]
MRPEIPPGLRGLAPRPKLPPGWHPSHPPVHLFAFLRSPLAVRALLGFAVAVLLLLGLDYRMQLQQQHEQTARTLQSAVDSLAQNAENKYLERRRSLMFLATTPLIKGLVRASEAGGTDPQGWITAVQYQLRMQQIFSAYLAATPEVYQVRFIGVANRGRELVSVERQGERTAIRPAHTLQDKADSVYFREALGVGEGTVFVSDVDLNRQHNQVELPHRPTIRYATPVHNDEGQVFGVIVINVDLTGRLGVLPGKAAQPQVFVTNAQGDFLAHPDSGRTFGFDLGQRHRWTDEFEPAAPTPGAGRTSWWTGPGGLAMAAQSTVTGNPGSSTGVLNYTAMRLKSDLTAAAMAGTRERMAPLLTAGLAGGLMLYLYWVGAQRKLQGRSDRLKIAAIVDQSPDAIIGLDNEGRVTSWNKGAQRLFGHSRQEAEGRLLDALILPPAQPGGGLLALDKLPGAGDAPPMELWRQTRNGQPVLVAMTVSRVDGEDGEAIGVSVFARDITAERAAQRKVVELKEGLEQEVADRTAALADERERLDNILRGTDAGTWEWNVQTGETRFNERWASIIGCTLDELQPTSIDTWTRFVHPDDLAASGQRLQAHFKGESDLYECEARMRHRDGHWVWVMDRGRVRSWSADGQPEWMYGTHQDISDAKRAQEIVAQSESLLRGAIDAVDEAFVLYDPDDRMVFCNERYRKVYPNVAHLMVPGVSFEAIVRASAELGDYPDAVGRVDEWVAERMAAHRSGHTELLQRLTSGRTMRIIERRMPDGHTVGFRIDITDLVHAHEQAQEASRIKGEFLANMSHEIRTPLNAMIGMTHLLGDTPLSSYQAQLLSKSRVASRSLLGLVNDVLDLAKIEAGGLDLDVQPFSPQDLLGEMDALFRAQAEASGIRYTVSVARQVPPVLLGDAQRVRQIFTNLIGNACKFTHGGSVAVSLDIVAPPRDADPRQVRLRGMVRDSGVGIDSETQARLFSPFTQADTSSTRRFSGTGLGLSIVRKLAVMMGGEVGLQSVPGEGSEFWFELVLGKPSPADLVSLNKLLLDDAARPAVRDQALRHLNLLLVDDSEINLEVAAGLLQREGARVCLARNGREAVEALRATPQAFDAVLMDLQMPEMDGLEATRRLRKELGLTDLPVIALTAGALAEERQQAFAAGMNAFLTKPLDPERLVRTVHDCVHQARGVSTPASEPAAASAYHPLPDAWPQIPGVDTTEAAQRLGGDLDLFLKSLQRLLTEFGEWGNSDSALPGSDREQTVLAARLHKLRGIAGTLGVTGLARLAQALEAGLTQPEPAPMLAQRWQALQDAMAALQRHSGPLLRAALQPRAGEAAPARVDEAELAHFMALLQRQDLDALSWWKRRREALRERLGDTLLERVGAQLDDLDFAGASTALTAMSRNPQP